MTGIILLYAVLVVILIVLTLSSYRLLDVKSLSRRTGYDMKAGISAALLLPVFAFVSAAIWLLIYAQIGS